MNFNSPTSTALDRSIADDLAQLALQVQTVALGGDHVNVALAGGQHLAEITNIEIMKTDAIHKTDSSLSLVQAPACQGSRARWMFLFIDTFSHARAFPARAPIL